VTGTVTLHNKNDLLWTAEALLMSLNDGLVEDLHGGRPPIDIDLDQFEKLCFLQCTAEEIAAFFEVSLSTIRRRLREDEFRARWDKGRAEGTISLRRRMWSTANSPTAQGAVQMQIHLSKHWLGMTEKAASVDVSVSVEVSSARERVNRKLDELSERLQGGVARIAAAAGAQLVPVGAE
jgi:hypothetical protein